MKKQYTIRVEGGNPEFDELGDLGEGVQADGFVLLVIRDGKPTDEVINGMTTMDLAQFFCTNTEVCSVLCQAAAISEGMRKASQIREEMDSRNSRMKAFRAVAEMMKTKFDDEK